MLHEFAGQTTNPDVAAILPRSLVDYRTDIQQKYSIISQQNENSPDIDMVGCVSKEVVRISGAEIQVFSRTDNNDIDHVYQEDQNPTFYAPIPIKAVYNVPTIAVSSETWGPDAKVSFDVFFSYQELLEVFGERMIRMGDVFKLPLNFVKPVKIRNFEVTSSSPHLVYMNHYVWWKCTVINITGDPAIRPEKRETISIGDHERE